MPVTDRFQRQAAGLIRRKCSRTFSWRPAISAAGLYAGLTVAALALSAPAYAGTWTSVGNLAPGGVNQMMLLSDGTVMAQNGGGVGWYKLTPNLQGSYTGGTWSTLASMHSDRLYYSSAITPDGH
ncbi:MAG: hypothetical protein ABIY70_24380, partial [Capsulimonas sp.]